jgi:hypothetical protein
VNQAINQDSGCNSKEREWFIYMTSDHHENKIDDKCEQEKKTLSGKEICFSDTHSTGGLQAQLCNGVPIVLFEDITGSHTKTMINAVNIAGPPCISTLIIETRGKIIRREIPFGQEGFSTLNIQLEDVKRISLVCEGNPTGICEVSYTITKTFIFCCSREEKDLECGCSKQENEKETCFMDQHSFSSFIVQPCDGSSNVVFEDLAGEHSNLFITALNFTESPCKATLIIETKNRTITRDLPAQVSQFTFGFAMFSIEVEDVRRLSLRCQGNPGGACTVSFSVQKNYCFCE